MLHARQQLLAGERIFEVRPLRLSRDLVRVGVKFSFYLGINLFALCFRGSFCVSTFTAFVSISVNFNNEMLYFKCGARHG